MRQVYHVEMEDGSTFDVTSDARDIRRWEALYSTSWLSSPLSFTEIAQLVHIAAMRQGTFNGQYPTYADFDAHCVEARGIPLAPVGNPTPPEAMDDSSAVSLSGYPQSPVPSSERDQPSSQLSLT